MANPPLVDVLRNGLEESVHRGAYAVVDGDGRLVAAEGNVERTILPRSSYKLMQAIPLVESGAADAFGLSDAELSIACASHTAMREHVKTVKAWLKGAGLKENDLVCGPQPPRDGAEQDRLIRKRRKPGRVHNNCSGKHTGFLTLARHLKLSMEGYNLAGHPVQERSRQVIADLCGVRTGDMPVTIDGCSAPNYGLPLKAFALGLARCASGRDMPGERAHAVSRLLKAQAGHPLMVAGAERFDSDIIPLSEGRLFTKVGAEGVYAGLVPHLGIGIALKIDDGAERAAVSAMCGILAGLGVVNADVPGLDPYHAPVLRNWAGVPVGRIRPRRGRFAGLPVLER